MNNQALLKRLQEVANKPELINFLIGDIKKEIVLDTHTSTDRQRIKFCVNFAEKMSKSYYNKLAVSHFENDTQYFTNSYFAVALKDNDIINELPKDNEDYQFKNYLYKANSIIYPNISNAFDLWKNETACYEVNVNDLLGIAKIENVIRLKLGSEVYFMSSENLKAMLTFLNVKEETITLHVVAPLKPITFTRANSSSKGLLSLMRGELSSEIKVYNLVDTRLE